MAGSSCHNAGMLARLGHARRLPVVLIGLLACLVACGEAPLGERGVPPPRQDAAARHAERFMVAAANPHAVAAGLAVLRAGGNALDAAIAAQMVLGFVEAPETGIGGGGFLLYREGASGAMHVYDGRETAPAAAGAERFRLFGVTLPWPLAVVSGRAVGVPGLVAMLAQAHAAHGALPWPALLEPAAQLAEQGVPMPPRLGRQLEEAPLLGWFGDMRAYFLHQARATPPRVVNPAYADTLREIARDGPGAFYAGPLARDVVARARARRWLPSDLTEADLAAYAPRERSALCRPYRAYTVCSVGPPRGSAEIGGSVGLRTRNRGDRGGAGCRSSRRSRAGYHRRQRSSGIGPMQSDRTRRDGYRRNRHWRLPTGRSRSGLGPSRPPRHDVGDLHGRRQCRADYRRSCRRGCIDRGNGGDCRRGLDARRTMARSLAGWPGPLP